MEPATLTAVATMFAAVVSVVGILAGTWVGAWVNRKSAIETARQLIAIEQQKYAQSQLWDARRASYSAIVASLNEAARLASYRDEGYNNGERHPEEYDQSDAANDLSGRIYAALSDARSEFDQSSLLLSERFAGSFAKLQNNLRQLEEDDCLPPEAARRSATIIRSSLSELREIARDEISLHGLCAQRRGPHM